MTTKPAPETQHSPVSAMLMIESAVTRPGNGLTPLDQLAGRRIILQAFCMVLRAASTASPALFKSLASGIATFLLRDFTALVAEEEEGLLHYLHPRLLLGDELDALISHLGDEHRQDCDQARKLALRCEEFASGMDTDWPELCENLLAFAEQQRRHLIWEDATIMPIARDRLQPDDLARWDIEMRQRYHMITCS